MKLLSYSYQGSAYFGAVKDRGIVELASRLGGDLRGLLERDDLERARELVAEVECDLSLDDIDYLPTLPNPQKIICIGVNYVNRNAEYRDNSDLPEYPSVFMRTRESLVGHRQPIMKPPESDQLDYEGEIAIVIGREGRRIPESQAAQHIAGLTLMNEGSVRDWLRHGKFNVTQGKNFEASGSLGPWLVTADETGGYENLHLTTRVNDEVRQDDTTANLLFPFTYLIHYLSTFMHLKPGDVIATGTPNGAGARFDPPRYLKPGDEVCVALPEVGELCNPIVNEHPG